MAFDFDAAQRIEEAEGLLKAALARLNSAYDALEGGVFSSARELCRAAYPNDPYQRIVMTQPPYYANDKICVIFPMAPLWTTFLGAARDKMEGVERLGDAAQLQAKIDNLTHNVAELSRWNARLKQENDSLRYRTHFMLMDQRVAAGGEPRAKPPDFGGVANSI